MPKRDPRIKQAAECHMQKRHDEYRRLFASLLKQHKPTRLAKLISDEELRLQRVTA